MCPTVLWGSSADSTPKLLSAAASQIQSASVTGSYQAKVGVLSFTIDGAKFVGTDTYKPPPAGSYYYNLLASADHNVTLTVLTSGSPFPKANLFSLQYGVDQQYSRISGNKSAMSATCSIDLAHLGSSSYASHVFSLDYRASYRTTVYENSTQILIFISVFVLPVLTLSCNSTIRKFTADEKWLSHPPTVEFSENVNGPGDFETILQKNGTRARITVYPGKAPSPSIRAYSFTYSFPPVWQFDPNGNLRVQSGMTTYSFFLNCTGNWALTRNSTYIPSSQGLGILPSKLLVAQSASIDFTVEVLPPQLPTPSPSPTPSVGLSIQPKSDVTLYPMKGNDTVLTVGYAGMGLTQPIRVELADTPPSYLQVILNASDLTPKPSGYSWVSLKVFFNTTDGVYPALPAEVKLTIRAKATGAEKTTQVTVKLQMLNWLILYYAESDGDLQLEVIDTMEAMVNNIKADEPRVAVLGLVNLRMAFYLSIYITNVRVLPGHSASFLIFEEGKITEYKRLGPIDMGNSQYLENLLQLGETIFPAKYRNLIIEDHGDGIRGIVFTSQGHHLSIGMVSEVLSKHKVNVLTLVACLMSQMEVLYGLRGSADYIVASELTTLIDAYPFGSFIQELYQNPHIEPSMLAKYVAENSGLPLALEHRSAYRRSTLVAVDTSKMEPLYASVNGLATALQKSYDSKDEATELEILKCGENSAWVEPVAPYIDLRSFADNLAKDDLITKYDIKKAATNVVLLLDAAIILKKLINYDVATSKFVNDNTYGGISILFYDFRFHSTFLDFSVDAVRIWNRLPGGDPWQVFLSDYMDRQERNYLKTQSSTLKLNHPGHELYLNISDSTGRHLGYNPNNPSLTKIDLEVDGASYVDMVNGTVVIYLPGAVTNYNITVDGTQMEEAKENYTLSLASFVGNTTAAEKVVTKTIDLGTRQTTPVTLTEKEITLGVTQIKGVSPSPQPTSPQPTSPQPKASGCLIATATYGSELSPEVQFLRDFRDNTVLTTFAGSSFMDVFNAWYYSFSPSVASGISGSEALRGAMKVILYPLIGILHLGYWVFSIFSFSPEIGVVAAGLVASTLIGLAYFLPWVLLFSLLRKPKLPVKTLRLTALVWGGSLIAVAAAEAIRSTPLMMASSGAFVLATIFLTNLAASKMISSTVQSLRKKGDD